MSEIKTILNFFDKNNGLDKIVKDLKEIKKLQEAINKQKTGVASDNLKERTAALKEITRLQKQLEAVRKKALKSTKESTGIQKELLKVEEQRRKVNKDLKVARTEKFKDLQESKLARQEQVRLVKSELKETSKLVSLYDRESAKLNRLRKELKNVILAEGEGSVAARKLQKEVTLLDTKLKKVDASAGQFQRNVGNYPNALKGAIGALKNFAGALGITAGITGLVRAVSDTITVFKDFEKSLSSLSSITGATGEDLKFYEEQAERIGETTTLSASQAVEAFKLIGSAKPELLANKEALAAVTEEAITLAEASGLELPEAASALTNALNQFNLPAEEAARVINSLAAGSKFGAVAIPLINEAIVKFGVVAKSANVSVEESVGLIELLGEKGIEGAEAGTKLRNVLTVLQTAEGLPPQAAEQLEKFGVNAELVADKTVPLKERIDELSKISGDATALVRVFGKQNLAAGQIVLENADRFQQLSDSVTGTNVAIEQAAINVDNLDGDLKSLSSVAESVQITIGKKLKLALRGFVRGLTSVIRFVKENTKLLIKLAKVVATVATGITAYRIAQNLANKESKISIFLSKADAVAKRALATINGVLSGKINLATKATKLFNRAVINNPVGLFIGVLTAAAAAFFAFKEDADEATEAQNEFNEAVQKGIDLREDVKTLEDRVKTVNKLNKVQLENLLEDIRTEISENEEKEAKLLLLAENRAFEIAKIEEENTKKLIALRQELAEAETDEDKFAIQLRIDAFEVYSKNLEKQEEGITKKEVEENKIRLSEFQKIIQARILELKKEEDARKKAQGDEEDSTLRTEKEIEAGRKKLAKEAEERRKAEAKDKKNREAKEDKEQEERLAKAAQRQKDRNTLREAEINSDIHEQERLAEERKKRIEEGINDAQVFTEAQIDFLNKETQARIDSLDRQIQAENDFISQNENLSAEEIEFRRKKAAELEAERIQEQKRLEKLAKVEAFFELVAAFASDGDGLSAIGKAAAAIATAETLTAGFHDGGYTGDGNEYKEAGVVHKGEFVNTKKQTTEYGMKGWSAKDFDKAVDEGYFNQFANSGLFADQNAKFLSVQNAEIGYDFARLENELRSVKDAIHNSPTTDFEINGEYFIKRTKRNGSTTIKKRKLG